MTDPLNTEFVRLMAESGWTPEQCSDQLGVTRGAISQYRNGLTRPSLTVLRLFSAKTGISLALAGEKPLVPRDGPSGLEPWEKDVLSSLRAISPPLRGKVIDFLEVLKTQQTELPAKTPAGSDRKTAKPASSRRAQDRTSPAASAADPSRDPVVDAFSTAIAVEGGKVALRSLGLPQPAASTSASNAVPGKPSAKAKGAPPKAAKPAPARPAGKKG